MTTLRHDAGTTDKSAFTHSLSPSKPVHTRPLRVALVHDWLTGLRGGEKCLERLCLLFPDATIHTLIHKPGNLGPIISRMQVRTSPLQKLPGVTRYYRHLLPLMPWAVSQIDVGNVDLVISLSHCVAKAVRVPAGVPHICYCFTPMRYAWDGRSAYLDKWPTGSVKRRLAEKILDHIARWDARTSASVSRFVAISQTISQRIQDHYGRDSVIIAPPVDTQFYTPDPLTQREDFYLAASALVPYKRIEQAVDACNQLGRKLVVIGSGPELPKIRALAGPTVSVLGYQPDEVLRDHMRRCRALIFSADEDFGILPIEALACGTPVIALGRGGVAETVDSSIGQLYSEPTVSSLISAIHEFERIPNSPGLTARARQKAESFSIATFDNRMIDLIQAITGNSSPKPPHFHKMTEPSTQARLVHQS